MVYSGSVLNKRHHRIDNRRRLPSICPTVSRVERFELITTPDTRPHHNRRGNTIFTSEEIRPIETRRNESTALRAQRATTRKPTTSARSGQRQFPRHRQLSQPYRDPPKIENLRRSASSPYALRRGASRYCYFLFPRNAAGSPRTYHFDGKSSPDSLATACRVVVSAPRSVNPLQPFLVPQRCLTSTSDRSPIAA